MVAAATFDTILYQKSDDYGILLADPDGQFYVLHQFLSAIKAVKPDCGMFFSWS